jgi:protein involved in polysaccharide export with SLBB domain
MRLYLYIWLGLACINGMAQLTTNTSDVAATNSPPNATAYVMDDKHVLEPGDVVSFQILEDQDPATNLVVNDSTELNVPYIGLVSVAGKTCRQLAPELKAMLEKEYYYQATVIIGLTSVNKVRGQVYIWGQVHNQGAINLLFNQNLTASEAILMAGGFSDFADKKNVKVIRNSGSTNAPKQTFKINMEDVQDGKTEEDIVLQPGDFIIVPAKLVNF